MVRIACIQPEVFQESNNCYSEIEKILNDFFSKHNSCDIICLPERWVPLTNEKRVNIQKERGKNYQFIKKLSKEYSVGIISGAIWEKRETSTKPRITSYFFNNSGEEIGRQDKIHLYSYEINNFEPGEDLFLFSFKNICFAILICFDMAFFETPRLAAENGADILFSPTQIRAEGLENWEIYLKARALENRIPIAACNTFGKILKSEFPGQSKIISFVKEFISPSKLRIVEGPLDSSGFIFDEFDLLFPKKLRELRFKEIIEKSEINIKKVGL
ncbi:MAG: carbon-nitrogen hydrolase family protein [Candidatus Lokiarchaeota archaeon]|nr:carbon-nitrogen hydrolase family protein [Candidatus Lokiarchaeota archaeon]